MFKKVSIVVALLVIATMVLSACAPAATVAPTQPPAEPTAAPVEPTAAPVEPTEAPVEEPTETVAAALPGEGYKICQVTDTGGIDDKSFNQTAWAGLEKAADDFGVEIQFLESQQQTDYERNINAFIDAKCDLIITVGFLLGDATKAAAEANPDQKFSIVDVTYDPSIDNVLGLGYATHEAAFMAGYMAAGMTKTGTVGTFGGIPIPPVTIFMDGFYLGVQYYNEVKGTTVNVLGWDPATQEGLFVGNFESTDDGRRTAEALMDEGADIILPVAGPVGLGSAAAVQERGNAFVIGVDSDQAIAAPEYANVTLTSIMKRMDSSVYDVTQQVIDGTFKGGTYVGTLENKGVSLGIINEAVPQELIDEVNALVDPIINGEIQTAPVDRKSVV